MLIDLLIFGAAMARRPDNRPTAFDARARDFVHLNARDGDLDRRFQPRRAA